ncbi:MAG: gltB [Burkholderiales bacterium]|jgi:glutamate synthase (NADPH/NADH) large chain|nr:gltB [Burkholderiales bacterium]
MYDEALGLYDPDFESDSCGVGIIANLHGTPSHYIVDAGLTMLERMEHRGAHGSEIATGDGAGIMLEIPDEFFRGEFTNLPKASEYAVAVVFLPKEHEARLICQREIEEALALFLCKQVFKRKVLTDSSILGQTASSGEPYIEQIFITRSNEGYDLTKFEQSLKFLRFYLHNKISALYASSYSEIKHKFYIASCSNKTIIYKGQLTTSQLRKYYADLHNPQLQSRYAITHSRFSTNTFPSFKLAQPFSVIAHNGEINTLLGNINWMNSRRELLNSIYNSHDNLSMGSGNPDELLRYIVPICNKQISDSANLDNAINIMLGLGYKIDDVMTMFIPEAWRKNTVLPEATKAFYHYNETLFEQWDGPAAVCFCDGYSIGAKSDRNGLRPLRYILTDELFIVGSEVGLVTLDEKSIKAKGRVTPGNILLLDLVTNQLLHNEEVLSKLADRHDYIDWCKKHIIKLPHMDKDKIPGITNDTLRKLQLSSGITTEDVFTIIGQMANTGKEPIGSMGIDTPLTILSKKPQHLASYFQQRFAQVTNPPLDPIRERDVMSLVTYIGRGDYASRPGVLSTVNNIELNSPILDHSQFNQLKQLSRYIEIDSIFDNTDNLGMSLESALNRICKQAVDAVRSGIIVLILNDFDISENDIAIPSLLSAAAVHQRLVSEGIRIGVGIIAVAGDIWEAHHVATLVGCGATAVYPYLAFATITNLATENKILHLGIDNAKLEANYIKALNDGLLKIISKMGVATVQSYYGAQLFEAVGISPQVIDKYFKGIPTKIGGLTLSGIAREAKAKHDLAYAISHSDEKKLLPNYGIYNWRKDQEFHAYNPDSIHLLQQSTKKRNYELFKKYSALVDNLPTQKTTLRSLLKFTDLEPIPLSEVESVTEILKRFCTGAMSFGSISYEAHTTLAKAMNQIGGRSNSGEGGEDEIRYEIQSDGSNLSSAIKQVASARFGVTINYLANAKELQIKIAQGAKPGEGGQLPGDKVDEWIAKVRHATPGVGLISPPPHHDIYSIEDLAQLIFDLKNANPEAKISVKLVAQSGVGTVAAGVAKAFADNILISGYDGGTGASPLSSISHAGIPWEIGLSETHQTLLLNKLRDRVKLQTDGHIKTGKDLAVATLLGAEEWGVSTAALVTTGCILTRKCHLNTCPVGIATQNKELRSLFTGSTQDVVTLFTFLAQELREIMANLGFRTVNDMVGRVDKLAVNSDNTFWKHNLIDWSKILYKVKTDNSVGRFKQKQQEHKIDTVLDRRLIDKTAIWAKSRAKKILENFDIRNTDRTVGAMLSNYVITNFDEWRSFGNDTIGYDFLGSAGQSFGAFLTQGITFTLKGEANDYVGKGLSGGRIIVYPKLQSMFEANSSTIIGNVAFYGATSGFAYINGTAGERFCVRNSGATVVVEGVGDHGCEYMTGGVVVILGSIGKNFASGMSGGIAYVYNLNNQLQTKCNIETVDLDPLNDEDIQQLENHIKQHVKMTRSKFADTILANWEEEIKKFVKVMPRELKNVMSKNKPKDIAWVK